MQRELVCVRVDVIVSKRPCRSPHSQGADPPGVNGGICTGTGTGT
jgi:hypothetical protein